MLGCVCSQYRLESCTSPGLPFYRAPRWPGRRLTDQNGPLVENEYRLVMNPPTLFKARQTIFAAGR